MLELVKAIRAGKLDLKPGARAGWYDYQSYALETFLLPERGPEHEKLLLDKEYKKRMLKAFASLLSKRRETHGLFDTFTLGALVEGDSRPKKPLPPRLRVEPNPTYFLRMARSYAFLQALLESSVGRTRLNELRGHREGRLREQPLGEELDWIKRFFYGLHLISCEDIGMRPSLLEGELRFPARATEAAAAWLASWKTDADLSQDSRVIVPIARDPGRGVARYWATLGVHAARLNVAYARAPRWATENGPDWLPAETTEARWLILVDEFAEVESSGKPPTRQEFRRIVDREGAKDKVVAALGGRP